MTQDHNYFVFKRYAQEEDGRWVTIDGNPVFVKGTIESSEQSSAITSLGKYVSSLNNISSKFKSGAISEEEYNGKIDKKLGEYNSALKTAVNKSDVLYRGMYGTDIAKAVDDYMSSEIRGNPASSRGYISTTISRETAEVFAGKKEEGGFRPLSMVAVFDRRKVEGSSMGATKYTHGELIRMVNSEDYTYANEMEVRLRTGWVEPKAVRAVLVPRKAEELPEVKPYLEKWRGLGIKVGYLD